MTAEEIRKKFLDFFAQKGHTIVPSDSLIPKDDPTVLFTTAGMQQFKRLFLGQIDCFTRAATCQKCLRTDDLDRVGQTAFHHTFFEMLGNFSFGDYFKKEAITWTWEFLTKELKIPSERLWVSVYFDDQEAEQIWLKKINIASDKLIKLGDKSNFWPSQAKTQGPNGPCGPCSEIFYDYGVNPQCKNKECNPDCDCGRFTEIWNLVFTQYNRKDGGILEPLPSKNIDTGMGLERLTAVIQGKKNNFDTDLFTPILKSIEQEIESPSLQLTAKEKFVIADHLRAIVFGITDGIFPSNKERGSVIKRLIIDCTNLVLDHGAQKATIYKLVPAVGAIMENTYPELKSNSRPIAEMIRKTEEAFLSVRQIRVPEFKKLVLDCQEKKKSLHEQMIAIKLGELYFLYHDTFGLPLPTILKITRDTLSPSDHTLMEKALKIYQDKMRKQKDRSRALSKMTGDVFTDTELNLNLPKTEFVGYTAYQCQSKILKIFVDHREVDQADSGSAVKIILDQTPFYAEAGGQIGDSGDLIGHLGSIRIQNTQKIADISLHLGQVKQGQIKVGDIIEASIDVDRRRSIMRSHTATHLLQAALRKILGPHVQQQGSLVSEDRLRFDFTHPQMLNPVQLSQIEEMVNKWILNSDPITKEIMPIDKAKQSGALAYFAEKYGKIVRVVSINNYSQELCGGTHLNSTGEIVLFKITQENAIAQGIRRLEAKTGSAALALINQQSENLSKIAQIVKVPVEELVNRIEMQSKKIKQLEKQLEETRLENFKNSLETILSKAIDLKGSQLVHYLFTDVEIGLLRQISDLIKQRLPSAIILLGSRSSQGGSLLIAVTDDLVTRGIKADHLIQQITSLIQGRGGGRPQLAQAGCRDTSGLEEAMKKAAEIIKEQLKS